MTPTQKAAAERQHHPHRAERLAVAARMFAAGAQYKSIATALGVSVERARQLVKDSGAFARRVRP